MAITPHPSILVHPGPFLRTEVVEPRGLSVTKLAEHLGVSRQSASAVMNGTTGITSEMAIRFEKVFGVQAELLLRMQMNYDLAQARAHADEIRVRLLEAA